MVKQVESKNKRSRDEIMADIMQAAIVEFSENGFPATSTQAIAERAGLSKAQLHYYIVGKDSCTKKSSSKSSRTGSRYFR